VRSTLGEVRVARARCWPTRRIGVILSGLDPPVLEGLAKAVELIADRAKGVRFQALWVGETPETQGPVSLKELLRAIRGNAVRNKHVYLVGGAG
jgi:hypothetical protein